MYKFGFNFTNKVKLCRGKVDEIKKETYYMTYYIS